MDFQQLYYTSCQSGLSGYPGYQFNAVTSGVSQEVMNGVEALGSYEPPSTLGHSPTPAQIENCPVNLCFAPGPKPIVANVVFTGTDYSGRFGNYFVHALVPSHADVWQGPAPIELWKARLWTRETVANPELPPLPGPLPTGPLRRDVVDDFLDRAPGRARLPALLAATERAILDEERSVVIIAADADEAAHWIAAVSFLLPPPLAARMSFATYQFRPSYSRQHVIGTVPGAEIVADERAFEAFYLFDFTAGTTGRASEVETGPLSLLLAGAGTVAAESLWRRAARLAAGDEVRLADWYSPAVAAALLDGGVGVGPEDLDAVCAWLPEQARRLDRDVVGRIGIAALDHDAVSAAQLTGLADAAAAGDLHELLAAAEQRLVTACLANAEAGAETPGRVAPGWPGPRPEWGPAGSVAAPLRAPGVREFAARRYTQLLAQADTDTMVRLLRLAQAHDVRPDPRMLHDRGLRVAGPQLLRFPSSMELHEAVRQWPELRAGTLTCLDQAAMSDATRLYAVFDAGLDEAVPDVELAALPALREAGLVARARRDPARRVDAALSVLSARGPAGRLDAALLTAIWPDGWSMKDATATLSRLPREARADPELVTWVTPLLRTSVSEDDRPGLESYAALCEALDGLPLTTMLSSELQARLRAVASVRRIERRFVQAGEKGTERADKERFAAGKTLLAAFEAQDMAAAKDYLRILVAEVLTTVSHATLAALLAQATGEIRHIFLTQVGRELDAKRSSVGVTTAAAAFTTLCEVRQQDEWFAQDIDQVLRRHLRHWRNRDLNAVERQVRRTSKRMAEEFKRWRLRHSEPRRRWLVRRQSQH